MSKLALYFIAFIVIITLLLFTCTFQVRFNQAAVVTTFGKARAGAMQAEPGLHFKWPYPIQKVEKYDTRIRLLTTQIESVETQDKQLVAVQVSLTWKIDDVLKFNQKLQVIDSAEADLKGRLRSALGVLSQYKFSDLLRSGSTPTEFQDSALKQAEENMLIGLIKPSDQSTGIEEYGIKPVAIGVTRFILHENTSKAVFERMKTTRQRHAANATSSGEAAKAKILADADANASKIEGFANRLAASIRDKGDREAAVFLGMQAKDEDFAIFLRELEALDNIVGNGTTVIAPFTNLFRMLAEPPTMLTDPDLQQLPVSNSAGQGG